MPKRGKTPKRINLKDFYKQSYVKIENIFPTKDVFEKFLKSRSENNNISPNYVYKKENESPSLDSPRAVSEVIPKVEPEIASNVEIISEPIIEHVFPPYIEPIDPPNSNIVPNDAPATINPNVESVVISKLKSVIPSNLEPAVEFAISSHVEPILDLVPLKKSVQTIKINNNECVLNGHDFPLTNSNITKNNQDIVSIIDQNTIDTQITKKENRCEESKSKIPKRPKVLTKSNGRARNAKILNVRKSIKKTNATIKELTVTRRNISNTEIESNVREILEKETITKKTSKTGNISNNINIESAIQSKECHDLINSLETNFVEPISNTNHISTSDYESNSKPKISPSFLKITFNNLKEKSCDKFENKRDVKPIFVERKHENVTNVIDLIENKRQWNNLFNTLNIRPQIKSDNTLFKRSRSSCSVESHHSEKNDHSKSNYKKDHIRITHHSDKNAYPSEKNDHSMNREHSEESPKDHIRITHHSEKIDPSRKREHSEESPKDHIRITHHSEKNADDSEKNAYHSEKNAYHSEKNDPSRKREHSEESPKDHIRITHHSEKNDPSRKREHSEESPKDHIRITHHSEKNADDFEKNAYHSEKNDPSRKREHSEESPKDHIRITHHSEKNAHHSEKNTHGSEKNAYHSQKNDPSRKREHSEESAKDHIRITHHSEKNAHYSQKNDRYRKREHSEESPRDHIRRTHYSAKNAHHSEKYANYSRSSSRGSHCSGRNAETTEHSKERSENEIPSLMSIVIKKPELMYSINNAEIEKPRMNCFESIRDNRDSQNTNNCYINKLSSYYAKCDNSEKNNNIDKSHEATLENSVHEKMLRATSWDRLQNCNLVENETFDKIIKNIPGTSGVFEEKVNNFLNNGFSNVNAPILNVQNNLTRNVSKISETTDGCNMIIRGNIQIKENTKLASTKKYMPEPKNTELGTTKTVMPVTISRDFSPVANVGVFENFKVPTIRSLNEVKKKEHKRKADEDVLSIYAESIIDEVHSDDVSVIEGIEEDVSTQILPSVRSVKSVTKEWWESSEACTDFNRDHDYKNLKDNSKIPIVEKNVNSFDVDLEPILEDIRKVCRYFSKCTDSQCTYVHYIDYKFKVAIIKFTPEQLNTFYEGLIATRNMFLIKVLFPLVVNQYSLIKDDEKLIQMIEEVLKFNTYKTPYIKIIIEALKNCDESEYDFDKSLNAILLTHGKKNVVMSDCLLDLITQLPDCVTKHWNIIKELTKCRNTELNNSVVENILQSLLNCDTLKKHYFECFVKDFLKKNCVNLSMIKDSTFSNLIKRINQYELYEVSDYLKSKYSDAYNRNSASTSIDGEKKEASKEERNRETMVLPPINEQIHDISPEDLISIKFSLEGDFKLFEKLILKYRGPKISKFFVGHLILLLKDTETMKLFSEMFFNFFKIYRPIFMKDKFLETTLMTIAFNALPYYEKLEDFSGAANIILAFNDQLDVFLDTPCLWIAERFLRDLRNAEEKLVYFIKFYNKANELQKASKLMMLQKFNVTDQRNHALFKCKMSRIDECIRKSVKYDLKTAKELIYYFFNHNENIKFLIGLKKHYNDYLFKVVNFRNNLKELIEEFETQIHKHYMLLDENILRALLIKLYENINLEKIFNIFQYCVDKQCYSNQEAMAGNVLFLYSHLVDKEIKLNIHIFFLRMLQRNQKPQDIEIQLLNFIRTNNTSNFMPNSLLQLPEQTMDHLMSRVIAVLHNFKLDFQLTQTKLILTSKTVKLFMEQLRRNISCS